MFPKIILTSSLVIGGLAAEEGPEESEPVEGVRDEDPEDRGVTGGVIC